MPCYHPIPAWRTESGEVVFSDSRARTVASLDLPCGRCVGCRLERARQWSVRIMHEAQLYEDNCFVTLTYDEDHYPSCGSLNHGDFQRFMKRLRRRLGRCRFYMCGEYGADESSKRFVDGLGHPHFHACLFGQSFRADRVYWRTSGSGSKCYRSAELERLWPFGASELGELTLESAAYVARYVMKKVNGDLANEHYKTVDRDTGEVAWRAPEYARMSLRPGIGAGWVEKFAASDVWPHDRVVVRGVPGKPPRYYDVLYERRDREAVQLLKEERARKARERFADNTPERLQVRETVAKARLSFKRRS